VGSVPRARVPPGLAAIHLDDQRQQLALAATDGCVRGVHGRHQMLIGMEIVPAHGATSRSGGGTSHTLSNMCSLVKSFGLAFAFPLLLTAPYPSRVIAEVPRLTRG
jgi:hypothetical protein